MHDARVVPLSGPLGLESEMVMAAKRAYFGRAAAIINHRERIKRKTIQNRRLLHTSLAASHQPIDEQNSPTIKAPDWAK